MQSGEPQPGALGRLSDETVHALLRVLLPVRAPMAGDVLEAYNHLADLLGKSQPQLKLSMQVRMERGRGASHAPHVRGDVRGRARSLALARHGTGAGGSVQRRQREGVVLA